MAVPRLPLVTMPLTAKEICQDMIAAAIAAANPAQAVIRHLHGQGPQLEVGPWQHMLAPTCRVVVVGGGKAAAAMALGLEQVLGDRIDAGRLVVPETALGEQRLLRRVTLRGGTHPWPSEQSFRSTRWMAALLKGLRDTDLVITLISGGASALLCWPAPGLDVEMLALLDRLLLHSGAPIDAVNVVRKQLSPLKGGGLARMARPATVLSLIISDVVGDRLATIGSGPTAADDSSPAEALALLERYGLLEVAPAAVIETLRRAQARWRPQRSREAGQRLERVHNVLVASNLLARQAMVARAGLLGLPAQQLAAPIQGEASMVGRELGACLRTEAERSRPVCLIGGGETTVTVRGVGQGGRNQELALAAALQLEGLSGVALASVATDGVDGPTDAAGAIVDGETAALARSQGFDPTARLSDNDSHPLLERCGALVRTGPTGTNVNDLVLLLAIARDQTIGYR